MGDAARVGEDTPAGAGARPLSDGQVIADFREAVSRERLLDMEKRLKPQRRVAFAILAVALLATAPKLGWWWLAPLSLGLAGFAVADRYLASSPRPHAWAAGAWGVTPLILAVSIAATGGPESPLVMWFAIPAVTLGARFEVRGIAAGAAYILALMLASTVAVDPAAAAASYELLVMPAALVLSTVVLSSALAQSERAHRRQSTIDSLTGVFNRSALDQRVSELEATAQNGPSPAMSFLLCDLDHFKRVNDEHGHSVGDTVLREAAYAMKTGLRASDTVYRIGGEEFLAIVPGADAEGAIEVADRIREAIAAIDPLGISMTVSIGVATSPAGRLNFDRTVASADRALYQAKAAGRDRTVLDGKGTAFAGAGEAVAKP